MYYNARHGPDCALRFCTENEEQRKWKTSIKVNRRHVPKTFVFGTDYKRSYQGRTGCLEEVFSETGLPAYGILGNSVSSIRGSRKLKGS
jgi:hypothetical protein